MPDMQDDDALPLHGKQNAITPVQQLPDLLWVIVVFRSQRTAEWHHV